MLPLRMATLWPASGLRVRAGNLELHWIDDSTLVELAELAGRGVHSADEMPFNVPWSRGSAVEVAQRVLAFQWASRALAGPEALRLELAVRVDGVPVGIQSVSSTNWSQLREGETGSWLGREFQGRGIGTRMRAVMVFLCFEALGAVNVRSAAFVDNPASNAVSRRVGYELDGVERILVDGTARTQHRYRITEERWGSIREHVRELCGGEIAIEGAEAFRAHLLATL